MVVVSFPKIWIITPKRAFLQMLNLAGPVSSSTKTIIMEYTTVISGAFQQWRVCIIRRSYRDCKEELRWRIKTYSATNYFKIVKLPRVPHLSLKKTREAVQIVCLHRFNLTRRQETSPNSKRAPKIQNLAKLFHHFIQIQPNLIKSLRFGYPSCHPRTNKLTKLLFQVYIQFSNKRVYRAKIREQLLQVIHQARAPTNYRRYHFKISKTTIWVWMTIAKLMITSKAPCSNCKMMKFKKARFIMILAKCSNKLENAWKCF